MLPPVVALIIHYIILVSFIIVSTLSLRENVAVQCFVHVPVVKNIQIQIQIPRLSPSSLHLSQSKQNHHFQKQSRNENQNDSDTVRVRLNKVFKASHSRREADKLIAEGRVSINGQRITSKGGQYVIPHVDVVALDGVVVEGWEDMNAIEKGDRNSESEMKGTGGRRRIKTNSQNMNIQGSGASTMTKSHFQYVKYYKPVGITCTTDSKIRGNIIDSIQRNGYESPHRIYPVGRLDKDTSGRKREL